MSKKELEQLTVFKKVFGGEISRVEAAIQLRISERWARKKFKRYLNQGIAGLVHKNRGKPSYRRWCENEREFAINLLRSEWHGLGPTFAAEKLYELYSIKTSKETVRTAMIRANLWHPKQKRIKHRIQRERKAMLGMMVQLDGSPHDWFEGRDGKCTWNSAVLLH